MLYFGYDGAPNVFNMSSKSKEVQFGSTTIASQHDKRPDLDPP
jgi:hypothetical protein